MAASYLAYRSWSECRCCSAGLSGAVAHQQQSTLTHFIHDTRGRTLQTCLKAIDQTSCQLPLSQYQLCAFQPTIWHGRASVVGGAHAVGKECLQTPNLAQQVVFTCYTTLPSTMSIYLQHVHSKPQGLHRLYPVI